MFKMWGACSNNILIMSYIYFQEIPKYQHVYSDTMHQASQILVIPNATQNAIAKHYGVNPFSLTDIECVSVPKYVYAYVLMCTSNKSMYDCGDEAGVTYGPLLDNKIALDMERQHNSEFGRALDRIIYNHRNFCKNV
jgi:hypothetical protein